MYTSTSQKISRVKLNDSYHIRSQKILGVVRIIFGEYNGHSKKFLGDSLVLFQMIMDHPNVSVTFLTLHTINFQG